MTAGSHILSHAMTEPTTVAELGVDRGLLLDIAIKTLFYQGRMTRIELCDAMKISGSAMQEVLHALTQDGLAAVLGSAGDGPANYLYALTQKGDMRAASGPWAGS